MFFAQSQALLGIHTLVVEPNKQFSRTCMFELVCLCLHVYATNTEQGVQLWVASTSQLLSVPLNHFKCLTGQFPTGTYNQATWTLTCKTHAHDLHLQLVGHLAFLWKCSCSSVVTDGLPHQGGSAGIF